MWRRFRFGDTGDQKVSAIFRVAYPAGESGACLNWFGFIDIPDVVALPEAALAGLPSCFPYQRP